MRVTWVGSFQHQRRWSRSQESADEVAQRHIVVMRSLVIPPADMHAHAIWRNIPGRMIERLHMQCTQFLSCVLSGIHPIAKQYRRCRQVWTVQLKQEAGLVNRIVLALPCLGQPADVGLLVAVSLVGRKDCNDPW